MEWECSIQIVMGIERGWRSKGRQLRRVRKGGERRQQMGQGIKGGDDRKKSWSGRSY